MLGILFPGIVTGLASSSRTRIELARIRPIMKIIIPGNPIPQARHRSFIRQGAIQSYDPQFKEKRDIKKYISYQLDLLLNNPIREIQMEASNLAQVKSFNIGLIFEMSTPVSLTNSKRNRFLWGLSPAITKPDLDNLAKFYLDCCNGIIYPDDCQVSKLFTKKLYSNKPKTIIIIQKNQDNMTHETVENILEMISPTDFVDIVEIMHGLSNLLMDINEANNNFDDGIHPKELTQAACFLSQLSNYAPLLTKINKKYGTFHEEHKVITQNLENFYAAQ